MRTYFLIFMVLTLAPMQALSASIRNIENLLSEALLISMKLDIAKLKDQIPLEVSTCIQQLDDSSFDSVVKKLVSENLSKDELNTAEQFLAKEVGGKYRIYYLRNIYIAAGQNFSGMVPHISATESEQIVNFVLTSVGTKIKRNEILIPNDTIKIRMIELSKGCGASVAD